MNKLFLMAALMGGVALSSTASIAGDHNMMKDHKGKMMEKIDANKDGKISKSEFMAMHAEKFEKIDADKDGYISKEEKKAAHKDKMMKMKDRMEKRKEMKDMKDTM